MNTFRLRVVGPESVALRCSCGRVTGPGRTAGWLAETWPTLGGGTVHVVACPPCRRLATAVPGARHDQGTCDGSHQGPGVWRGRCFTGHRCSGPRSWSCWHQDCVQAWASRHDGCHVEITQEK